MDMMGFSSFGSGFDFMFSVVPVIVILGFIVVFGFIIINVVKGGMEWNRNNNSPILTVSATVVAKRTAVSSHDHNHGNDISMHHYSSSTTYFATFEVESGDPGCLSQSKVRSAAGCYMGEQRSGIDNTDSASAKRPTSRMELKMPDKDYGMLVEGDVGKLTFQGTRYKGFEHNREQTS
jgi:hypothetical protein